MAAIIGCCARAASGQAAAALPSRVMNCRRFMLMPGSQNKASYPLKSALWKGSGPAVLTRPLTVRFTFHCGHSVALLRTAAVGQLRTLAPQQTALLFDHLVGAGEQREWQGDAEHLCGLEIDGKLELGRRLHRKVGRLLAAQNLAGAGECYFTAKT
jgi:hypothetical protein